MDGGGGSAASVGEVAAFAEDAAEDFGDGEDVLAVGDGLADGGGDPGASLQGASLVARGAEVAGFAGEGEEVLVAAVGSAERGEAGGEVAIKSLPPYSGLYASPSYTFAATDRLHGVSEAGKIK